MSGRSEINQKWQKLTERALTELPQLVTDYYYNISASLSPSTCNIYIMNLRGFIRAQTEDPKNFDVCSVTEADITRFLVKKSTKEDNITEQSFSMRKTLWSSLQKFFTYLYKRGAIERNPMEVIPRPMGQDDVKRVLVTEQDIKKILEVIKGRRQDKRYEWQNDWLLRQRDICIFEMFIYTGMRLTALTQIDISDIDLTAKTLTVIDKRHKTTVYNLNWSLFTAICLWLHVRNRLFPESEKDRTNALFITQQGTRISREMVAYLIERYSEQALGYSISPHKLRAAFCSILYEKTRDIEFVRDAVGHSSTAVTQRYIVKKEPAQKKAVEMLEDIFA